MSFISAGEQRRRLYLRRSMDCGKRGTPEPFVGALNAEAAATCHLSFPGRGCMAGATVAEPGRRGRRRSGFIRRDGGGLRRASLRPGQQFRRLVDPAPAGGMEEDVPFLKLDPVGDARGNEPTVGPGMIPSSWTWP